MNKHVTQNKIEAIGNGITLILGLAFLGDLFELWSFHPFDGWWVLFLYIPVISGFLTKGLTSGGIMLTLTATFFTVGMFIDVDGRLWSITLLLYLAYLGGRSLFQKWHMPDDDQLSLEGTIHHES